MRLIDADTLLENIKFSGGMHDDNYIIYVPYKDVKKNIENAPTVNGWISIKDRMPELDQEVLVYAVGKIDGFFGDTAIAICKRFVQRIFPSSPGHEIWSSPWQYFHTDYQITHWMPLPEPPKEEIKHD